MSELREQVRGLLARNSGVEWPRAAIVHELGADPRDVSNALRYWQRRNVATCCISEEGDPVWAIAEGHEDDD